MADGNGGRVTVPVWLVVASLAVAIATLIATFAAWQRSLCHDAATLVPNDHRGGGGVVASPRFFERRWNATTAAGFRLVVIDDFATTCECENALRVAAAAFMRQPRLRRTSPMDRRRPLERRLLVRSGNVAETSPVGRSAWIRLGAASFSIRPHGAWCMVLCCDDDVETLTVEPCGLALPGRRARCFWFYWAPSHAERAVVCAKPTTGGIERRAIVALLAH